jgi:predicted metallopeptidase
MTRLEYKEVDGRLKVLLDDLIENIGDFKHISKEDVYLIYSNSSSRTLAFCHGLPKWWQVALRAQPKYVVAIHERQWTRLNSKERLKVLVHELYHIPRTFSGGLRDHKENYSTNINEEGIVEELMNEYLTSHPVFSEEEARAFIEGCLE